MRKEDFSRPHKARRVKSKVFVDALSRMSQNTGLSAQNSQEDTVQYHLSSKEDWERWFSDAFRAVQQVSCRTIAKEWIKLIHPKKQSTHPYNGKNPRTGERGDPDSTKPSYWPRDVIHKEPDHINKQGKPSVLSIVTCTLTDDFPRKDEIVSAPAHEYTAQRNVASWRTQNREGDRRNGIEGSTGTKGFRARK